MTGGRTPDHSGASPLRRAHVSLSVLIGVSVLAAGGLSMAVSAPPSPLAGVGFAAGAVILLVAMTLAGRVTIALERARRRDRPPVPPLTNAPVFSRLMRLATSRTNRR